MYSLVVALVGRLDPFVWSARSTRIAPPQPAGLQCFIPNSLPRESVRQSMCSHPSQAVTFRSLGDCCYTTTGAIGRDDITTGRLDKSPSKRPDGVHGNPEVDWIILRIFSSTHLLWKLLSRPVRGWLHLTGSQRHLVTPEALPPCF